jgi:4-hydroxybenzoate polyprenyltransferase
MVALQASIGALNDLRDAPLDAGRKPGKPIPIGRATTGDARIVIAAGLLGGLALSAPSGAETVAVAVAGVACGYVYDLGLSRTATSWLPFAIAVPLVPVYAWLGATGALVPSLIVLVPIGFLAGAGLAIANGLADLERDEAAGAASTARRLGRDRAWIAHAGLLATAVVLAVLLFPLSDGGAAVQQGPVLGGVSLGAFIRIGFAAGAVLVGVGVLLGRGGGPARRERAWELEAIGVAVVGAAWVAGIVVAG